MIKVTACNRSGASISARPYLIGYPRFTGVRTAYAHGHEPVAYSLCPCSVGWGALLVLRMEAPFNSMRWAL